MQQRGFILSGLKLCKCVQNCSIICPQLVNRRSNGNIKESAKTHYKHEIDWNLRCECVVPRLLLFTKLFLSKEWLFLVHKNAVIESKTDVILNLKMALFYKEIRRYFKYKKTSQFLELTLL